jgi:hypothetical protein
MKAPYSLELVGLCETRLEEITRADSTDLTEFAEHRLMSVGISPSSGEDVTQRAFQLVLQGLESDQGGRKPRLEDLVNKTAFINYMRGIISSIVHGMTVKCGFQVEHTQWNDETPVADGAGGSPADDAEFDELRARLFQRLRARAPKRLLSTIEAWEPVCHQSDRIPTPKSRKYARQTRELAQKVLPGLLEVR